MSDHNAPDAGSDPPEVIFYPLDVVFSDIIAILDLNEPKKNLAETTLNSAGSMYELGPHSTLIAIAVCVALPAAVVEDAHNR
jgi:hypothetical protein